MKRLVLLLITVALIIGCNDREGRAGSGPSESPLDALTEVLEEPFVDMIPEEKLIDIYPDGRTVEERFGLPDGCLRVDVLEESFAEYLRTLKLKEHGADVKYFDGRTKGNKSAYVAVVDMDVGNRNLQQCADAVMRLRGEYLYQQGEFDSIHFNLTNGFRMDYSKWMDGQRVLVEGNSTTWTKGAEPSNTYNTFRKYMDFVFAYAGTLSLSQELEDKNFVEMTIGDILIKGGSPGHCVIVVDMAMNSETGEMYYMLAQSFMPAQDIQILRNPNNDFLSPWYRLEEGSVDTPEWSFTSDQLKTFEK